MIIKTPSKVNKDEFINMYLFGLDKFINNDLSKLQAYKLNKLTSKDSYLRCLNRLLGEISNMQDSQIKDLYERLKYYRSNVITNIRHGTFPNKILHTEESYNLTVEKMTNVETVSFNASGGWSYPKLTFCCDNYLIDIIKVYCRYLGLFSNSTNNNYNKFMKLYSEGASIEEIKVKCK
jgi:hypothetical protein